MALSGLTQQLLACRPGAPLASFVAAALQLHPASLPPRGAAAPAPSRASELATIAATGSDVADKPLAAASGRKCVGRPGSASDGASATAAASQLGLVDLSGTWIKV